MKKLLLSVLAGCLLIPALQLNASRSFKPGDPLPGCPLTGVVKSEKKADKALSLSPELINTSKKSAKSMNDNQLTCEVKCVFKYDPESFTPSSVAAYNVEEGYDEYYDWENDFIYLDMAPGKYDFRATYYRVSETSLFGTAGDAYLILEDIEVNGDMEVVLDASLITEVISFETYNPTGEKTALRNIRYLNENWDWEIITEYNVYDFYCDNYIMHKDYGSFSNHVNAGGVEVEPGPCGEWKSEWSSNIYINKVSDKYQIAQLRMLYNETECWIVPMFADGSDTQTVTNKGEKYSDVYDVTFEKTPEGKDCDVVSDGPYSMNWGMSSGLKTSWLTWGLTSTLASFHHFRYCPTASSRLHPEYIYYMDFSGEDTAEILGSDKYYDEEGNLIFEEVNYATTSISTPIFVLGLDACTLYPQINNRFLSLINQGMESDNSFQPPLGYEVSPDNMPVFGASPQFMQFYYQTYDSRWYEYPIPMLSFYSLSYFGAEVENRNPEIKVSLNGKVVADSNESLYDWQDKCMESPMETGKLEFDYLNENIKIDGLAGRNSAKVVIDTSAENFSMPLIQAVQLRNAEGQMTVRFADSSEGIVKIAGGDFREMKGDPNLANIYGECPMWYDVYACELTVESAPYGSNDYKAIEMSYDDIEMTGFGRLFSGSLKSEDRASASGWFDLRILMTDAAGNTQEQIISPAFNIDKLTDVQQIYSNKANLRVVAGSVISDLNSDVEVFTLSGQKVINSNLPAGMYVARCADSSAKLVVK